MEREREEGGMGGTEEAEAGRGSGTLVVWPSAESRSDATTLAACSGAVCIVSVIAAGMMC